MDVTGNVDVNEEDLLTIDDVCQTMNNRVSWDTVKRWMVRGVNGGRLKLDAIRVGRRYFTSREALDRFCRAHSSGSERGPRTAKVRASRVKALKARGLA